MAKKTAAERRADRRLVLERQFAALYIANQNNGTRAYQAIFPRAQARGAAANASEWLTKANVQAEIERITNEAYKRAQAGADKVLAELSNLGFSDMGNLLWKPEDTNAAGEPIAESLVGTLKPIHMMSPEVRRTIKSISWDILGRPQISLWSEKGALTRMAQHHKLLTDKIEIGYDKSFGDLLEDARRKMEGK